MCFFSLIVTRACQVVVIHHIGIKMISISRLRLYNTLLTKLWGCIGGVVVNVIASSAVDDGFEPRSGQTKDYINKLLTKKQLHYQIWLV